MTITSRTHGRRIVLVDHSIQNSLLLALVVMESVMALLAIWALYSAMGSIIDDNLYRIHLAKDADLVAELFHKGVVVLGWMLFANFLALIAADRLWALYVGGILRRLDKLMARAAALDFAPLENILVEHAVLVQATTWREAAFTQLIRMRQWQHYLPPQLPTAPEDVDGVRSALVKMQQVLE